MGSLGLPEVFKTQVLTERRVILGKASWNLRFQEGKTEVVSDLAANGRGRVSLLQFALPHRLLVITRLSEAGILGKRELGVMPYPRKPNPFGNFNLYFINNSTEKSKKQFPGFWSLKRLLRREAPF